MSREARIIRVYATPSELFIRRTGSDDYYAYNVGSDGRLRFTRKGEWHFSG